MVQWSDNITPLSACVKCVFVCPVGTVGVAEMLFMKRVSKEVGLHMHCLLTSLSGTFALNVHMAPFSVLFEGAALLVAPTTVVALEGLLYCKKEFQLFTSTSNINNI